MRSSVFFFSSRRRHTRWPRDWSSDVCSSDLARPRRYRPSEDRRYRRGRASKYSPMPRSEERRVGKEGGTREGGAHIKQKEAINPKVATMRRQCIVKDEQRNNKERHGRQGARL